MRGNFDFIGFEMKIDPYSDFAESYDLFHEEFGKFYDPNIEGFFRNLFEKCRIRRVLDCACGTGQHLPLFAALGCEVVGSDISDAMLLKARRNLASIGIVAHLVRADFRELDRHFSTQFDAVLCLGMSLPHLLKRSEVARMLENTRKILRPGGLLVITQGISDKFLTDKPTQIPVVSRPGFSRIFEMEFGKTHLKMQVRDLILPSPLDRVHFTGQSMRFSYIELPWQKLMAAR